MTPEEDEILFGEEKATSAAQSTLSTAEKLRLAYQESTTSPPTRDAPPGGGFYVKRRLSEALRSTLVVSRRHRLAIVAIGAFLVVGLSQVGNLGVKTDQPLEAREAATFVSAESLSRAVAIDPAVADQEADGDVAPHQLKAEVLSGTVDAGPARTVVPAETTNVVETTETVSFAEITVTTTVGAAPDQVSLSLSPDLPSGNCHPSYEPCIPDVNYDLTCDAFAFAVEIIGGADPYGFDPDGDGIGCERNE